MVNILYIPDISDFETHWYITKPTLQKNIYAFASMVQEGSVNCKVQNFCRVHAYSFMVAQQEIPPPPTLQAIEASTNIAIAISIQS
jgi:hypothetical protein